MNYAKYVVLLSALSILFALSSLVTVYAEEGDATTTEEPKFLAIQNAQSGSISKINDTAYTLELNDVSKKTILFSDRPDRIVTSVSTSDFVGNWSVGQDSFAEDAPNAVLVIDEQEQQESAIIELFSPIYDNDKNTLKYDATLDDTTSLKLSTNFGKSTLIIDSNKIEWEEAYSLYAGRK